MHQQTGVSGIILAGGKNSRMGRAKALLEIGGRRIIEIVAAGLRPVTREIIIVTDSPQTYSPYGDRVVGDILPGHGPLGGLHAGLTCASHPRALVTACDMPFVSTAVAALLVREGAGYDICVPCYRGYLEPLFALYHKNCLAVVEHSLHRGRNKITGFYHTLRVRRVGEEELRAVEPHLEKAFMNVNTPADLARAQSLV